MSLVGSLEDLGLGDILQIVSLSRKSGVLVLRSEAGDGQIVLSDGLVRGASIKGEPEDLRGLLVARGAITEEEFDRAVSQSARGDATVEDSLVENTGADSEQIESLRRDHVERAVMRMFLWRSGEFSFEVRDAIDAADDELFLSTGINTQYLAMEATRLRDEAGGASALPPMVSEADDGDEVPLFSGEAEERAGAADATPDAVDALALATARSADSEGGEVSSDDAEPPEVPAGDADAVVAETPDVPAHDADAAVAEASEVPADDADAAVAEASEVPADDADAAIAEASEVPADDADAVIADATEAPAGDSDTLVAEESETAADDRDTAAAGEFEDAAAADEFEAAAGDREPEAVEEPAAAPAGEPAESGAPPSAIAAGASMDAPAQEEAAGIATTSMAPQVTAGAAEAAAKPTPAPSDAVHVVAIDPSLAGLEWFKVSVDGMFRHVHIFQRSDIGIERIRRYLGRGVVPLVVLSPQASGDPMTDVRDVGDLIRRLRSLAPKISVVALIEEDTQPQLPKGVDCVIARPVSPGLDSEQWHRYEATAQRLREALAPWTGAPAAEPAQSTPSPKNEELGELREVSARLRDPSTQGEVLSVVLDFAAGCFSRVAIFVIRDDLAAGLAQRGMARAGGPGDEELTGIQFDAETLPELFRAVLDGRTSVRSAMDETNDHRLAMLIGTRSPREAYAAPIESGGCVVALLYADNLPEERPLADTTGLEIALHEAGLALDRALLERTLANSGAHE
jgi:hypothetical protein